MHALEVIASRNAEAVWGAWQQAHDRGDEQHAAEIVNANPDLFQVTAMGYVPRRDL